MSGLHGVETIELTSGTVAVQTISTAVIGLVGTAPDASAGVAASGSSGSQLLDNMLTFTAATPGKDGNNVTVTAVAGVPDPDNPAEVATAAVMTDGTLTITLGCDGTGKITAVASEVGEVVDAAIQEIGVTVTGTGKGGVAPFTLKLAGGEDEPFPIGTPVVVAGALAQASKLGTRGTLYPALMDIFDQTGALVIVVRADSNDDQDKQTASIISAMKGWTDSKTVTQYQPRILIATGFSENDSVSASLETYAAKLRAVTYIDSPSMATMADVAQRRQAFGGRVELLRPRVAVTATTGAVEYRPYSARAAGLRARIDYEKGWWWSKSNQEIYNILGLEQADEFILGEQNCAVNLLNMENISCIIRHTGFKHWGNRLCIDDPQWHFETVRRTADVIEDSIQEAMLPYN